MSFSFPTAKLLAFANVAATNGDCARAITATARELGLIGMESLSELSCTVTADLRCGSMLAVKQILHEYLTAQGHHHRFEQLCREIEEDITEYKRKKELDCVICPNKQQCHGMVAMIIESILHKLSK